MKEALIIIGLMLLLSGCITNGVTVHELGAYGNYNPFIPVYKSGCIVTVGEGIDVTVVYKDSDCAVKAISAKE